MKKVIKIILVIVLLLVIGILVYLIVFNKPNDELLVGIDNVSFSLNNIKDKFLTSDYSLNNNCQGSVNEEGIIITCNNKEYNFVYNGYELELNTDTTGIDVFKYMVLSIEQLHGIDANEYLETIEKFINGLISINGLRYEIKDQDVFLSVYLQEPLEIYEVSEVLNEPEIKELADTDYELQKLGYTISNIEITKDSQELLIVFAGIIAGQDNYDVDFIINYYDANNNLVVTETVNLNDYDTYNNPYLGFVVTSRLLNNHDFDTITKYSINLIN